MHLNWVWAVLFLVRYVWTPAISRGFLLRAYSKNDVTSMCLAGWSHIQKLPPEAALHLRYE